MIKYGKSKELSRNFIFFDDLDNYLNVLTNKILKNGKGHNVDSLKELFKSLENLKEKNESEYEYVIETMKNYTEEFVISNSHILNQIIGSNEEMENIAVNFGYENKLDSIGIIKDISDRYNEIVEQICDDIISGIDPSEISNVALEVKNDEKHKNDAYLKLLDEYPSIVESLVLQELVLDLEESFENKVYDYMTSVRGEISKNNERSYSFYFRNAASERLRKKSRGLSVNPQPYGFRSNKKL